MHFRPELADTQSFTLLVGVHALVAPRTPTPGGRPARAAPMSSAVPRWEVCFSYITCFLRSLPAPARRSIAPLGKRPRSLCTRWQGVDLYTNSSLCSGGER